LPSQTYYANYSSGGSFSSKEKIFTKNEKIRKANLTKINKAYHIYTGKSELP
jgi:hypothetical protein